MGCKKCGNCCRDWKVTYTLYRVHDEGAPNDVIWEIPVTGQCDYLVGNLCSIYERRPIICRNTRCWVEDGEEGPKINSGVRNLTLKEGEEV